LNVTLTEQHCKSLEACSVFCIKILQLLGENENLNTKTFLCPITSAKEVMFSLLSVYWSVCPLVNSIIQKLLIKSLWNSV